MSLRHVEEGLTALSYPHVAYYLRGEQGYGRPRPNWLDEGDMPLHRRPQSMNMPSRPPSKGKPIPQAYGNPLAMFIASAVEGVTIAAVASVFVAQETTAQTKMTTAAAVDVAESNVSIAEATERTRRAEAEAQIAINRNVYLLEMERLKSVPLQIGAGLAGVIVLAVVFAPKQRASQKTGSASQTQKQSQSKKTSSAQRKAQRSL